MKHTRHEIKKIGVYDSGLGGLFLMSHLRKAFPAYDYTFLGDEANLPYGSRSVEELQSIARKCIDYLFEKESCDVVVIACNTISTAVYPLIAKEYAERHPGKLLVDIVTPTIDTLDEDSVFSVFGTERTVASHVYRDEIKKRFPDALVHEYAMHDLAMMIEESKDPTSYLENFKHDVHPASHTCILACTHYGIAAEVFHQVFPQFAPLVCQHTVLVDLMHFILHHDKTTAAGTCTILVTKGSPIFDSYTRTWFDTSAAKVVEV